MVVLYYSFKFFSINTFIKPFCLETYEFKTDTTHFQLNLVLRLGALRLVGL